MEQYLKSSPPNIITLLTASLEYRRSFSMVDCTERTVLLTFISLLSDAVTTGSSPSVFV